MIVYLRLGWVVGSVGLLATILIITISPSIPFPTALAVATIATDRRVRLGGAYCMLSRTLRVESGGAIGLPLYMALALKSVTLVIRIRYLIMAGVALSLASLLPGRPLGPAPGEFPIGVPGGGAWGSGRSSPSSFRRSPGSWPKFNRRESDFGRIGPWADRNPLISLTFLSWK